MKLISFDIGIKNMAYCILDVSGELLSIQGWDVLNLLEEEPSSEICSQIIPGKTKKALPKPCTKIAKYRKNGQCYCDKHSKKSSPFIIPNKKNSVQYLKKLKVDELIKLGQSHFLFLDLENPPKLKRDILDKIVEFYEKNCFESITKKKTKNSTEIDLITIGKNMKELLNIVENINEITHVLIENQISPIANRMKTVQGMLAQYFIMKNSDIHIEFVSSTHKLSQFTRGTHGSPQTPPLKVENMDKNGKGSPKLLENMNKNIKGSLISIENTVENMNKNEKGSLISIENTVNKVENHSSTLENTITFNTNMINPEYKQHKKDGLYYCSQLLDKNPRFSIWSDSLKRKKADDLADSFLQGMWYLKNKNIISYADDLKINIV